VSGRRSLARTLAAAAIAVAAGALISGCATSKETAAMIRLNDARTIAGQSDLRVKEASTSAKPVKVALVRARHGAAFVVTVHNAGNSVQSDLPISVGYTQAGGHQVYVNSGGSLVYFEKHLPGIAPHRSLTWVFTTTHRIPAGAHLFARVGPHPVPAAPSGASAISLSVRTKAVSAKGLTLMVTNNSSLPQYKLQLYSYALRRGRYVAAANTTLNVVNPGASERVQLPLVGRLAGANPITTAVPTILNDR
jgi:hypothetical protein